MMSSLSLLTLLSLLPSSLLTSHHCPGFYPAPQACDQFYQCDSQKSYLFHCPAGTLFDANLGFCNHQYLVKCPSQSQPQTTSRPTTSEPRPQQTVRPDPAPITTAATVSTDTVTLTETETDLTTQSSSDNLLTDNDNIFIDLSKPSTPVLPSSPPAVSTSVSPPEETTSASSSDVVTDLNLPSDSAPVTRPEPVTSTPAPSQPEFLVSAQSLYPCSQPGYYSEETSCSQFYVCKEVAPGVLSADRIFR